MAARIAALALKKAVPLATSSFAKSMPGAVARAKEFVAKATNTPASTVNLGLMAGADGGMRSQIVAEAMVKAGYPVDKIWSHIPATMINDAELEEYRGTLVAIQARESSESSARSMGDHVPRSAAMLIDEKNRSIRYMMRMLGTDSAPEVWNFKVELDHLTEGDIENFQLLNNRG